MPVVIPSPGSRKRARIEIIPLIDIMFFLLATFVMVSLSMVKNRGIPVNLPGASTAHPQDRGETHFVSLTRDGVISLDRQPLDASTLEAVMRDLQAAEPDPRLLISGDTDSSFGTAVLVLDTARRLGIRRIAIQTKAQAASDSQNVWSIKTKK
ncbi:MAG: biopolymer transporter ExbD [Verrucomicrobia bacterium]|nr:biopolymer transporter ExbD [Verrucomicrobiota bacterium]